MTFEILKREFAETSILDLNSKYSKLQLTMIYNNLSTLKGCVGTSGDKVMLIKMIKEKLN